MKESLSALVDDELDVSEQHRVLGVLAADVSLRRAWERYHVIGAALRNEFEVVVPRDFGDRVAGQIEALAPATATVLLWRRPVVARTLRAARSLAIAASLAAVAVAGWRWFAGPLGPVPHATQVAQMISAPSRAQVAQVTQFAPAATQVASASNDARSSTRWDAGSGESVRALDVYLVEHNEYAPTSGVSRMIPYVRVVGQTTGR